jgi:hypothetical protein
MFSGPGNSSKDANLSPSGLLPGLTLHDEEHGGVVLPVGVLYPARVLREVSLLATADNQGADQRILI